MKILILSLAVISLVGCHGSEDGTLSFAPPPPPPPPTDEAIGGIWQGTDSDLTAILALSTESGRIHFINGDGNQGFGTAVVDGTAVTINYTLVPEFGTMLIDGSTFATCSAAGTIRERQSLSLTTNCTTELGAESTVSALLAYDNLYDRDSSLATIAGIYNDFTEILTIDANGVLFEQNSLTGCVYNGQVSIIDSNFNAYDILLDISGCGSMTDILNGSVFTGIATLDNIPGNPEVLIAGLTGNVAGVTVAIAFEADRL